MGRESSENEVPGDKQPEQRVAAIDQRRLNVNESEPSRGQNLAPELEPPSAVAAVA
jgi:hypothetical protein